MDREELESYYEGNEKFNKRILLAGSIVAGPIAGYFIGERVGAYESGRKQVEDIRPGFTILANNGAFQVGNPTSYLIKEDGTRKVATMENLTSSEIRDIGRQISPYQGDIDSSSMNGAGIGLASSLGLVALVIGAKRFLARRKNSN